MRRWARIVLRLGVALMALPLVLGALLLIGGNTAPGRAALAWLVGRVTGGNVEITALAGRFPDRLRAGRIVLRDADGIWLRARDVGLDWSPLRLLGEGLDITQLDVRRAEILRLPRGSDNGGGGGGAAGALRVRALHVGELDFAPAPSSSARFQVDGELRLGGSDDAVQLTLAESAGGTYRLSGTRQGDMLKGAFTATEPADGLLARLGGAPGLGALDARMNVAGPLRALRATLSLRAGPLQAHADGTIDAEGQGADMRFSAEAPSMAPGAQLAWASLRLRGSVKGAFAAPDIDADLAIDTPRLGDATAQRIIGTVRGHAGRVSTDLRLEGPRLPGLAPDTLTEAPLRLHADLRLDAPGMPVTFSLAHPLIQMDGTASVENGTAAVDLRVARLQPFAAATGVDMRGDARLNLRAERAGTALRLRAEGALGLTAGPAPLPALLGTHARLSATGTWDGGVLTVPDLRLDGAKATFTAKGRASARELDLGWTIALADLQALAAPLRGQVSVTGHLSGPADDARLDADLDGVVSAATMPAGELGRLSARLRAEHLPRAPTASLAADGVLAGAQVRIDLTAGRMPDGAARLDVRHATWRSADAAGSMELAAGSAWPTGRLEGGATRLDDFSPLLGKRLAGSLRFTLAGGPELVTLTAEARDADMAGIGSAGRVWLDGKLRDPAGSAVMDGEMGVEGASAGGIAGSARLALSGDLADIRVRLNADLSRLAGAPGQIAAAGGVDVPARAVALSSLTASWRGESARLLSPARIELSNGARVDRIRIGLRDGELDVSGSAAPRLDMTGAVKNLPLDLIATLAPGAAIDGRLSAEARLSGTLAAPAGQVTLQVSNARARAGIGHAMPPASLSGTVRLAGTTAQLDLHATAGRAATLAISGQAPLSAAGPLAVRLSGNADLTLLDPVLTPAGRRARGRVALDATLGGRIAAPRLGGTATIAGGEVQDFALGARIDRITGRISAEGGNLRIADLRGRAGNGDLALAGTIGVLEPALPVDLTLTAHGARALAADRLTAVLDAALSLRGSAAGTMTAQGRIDIQQASIRVPERLPVAVATLNVRRPGAHASPGGVAPGEAEPAQAGPANILLDVAISGQRLALSGRGINAEFAGNLGLHGSLAAPRPDGGFRLRRGEFNLAGRTLNFTKGEISFNGGALSNPSLDLTASSTSGTVTATIAVTGTAQKPAFKLSSVPELPQDEVLARLLFDRDTSKLSPVELAQIAATLASLGGAPSSVTSPLESLRQGLGLDRLSVGGDAAGNPSLSAGRYVAPGVYVGAKQGTGGAGATQGAVQIDLTDRLKLEGTFAPSAGTLATGPTPQSSGTGVGITYQFEY